VRVGQRVALTGKGGCCPPILIWNKILACIFSLSFQTLQDKKEGHCYSTLRPERGGEGAGVVNLLCWWSCKCFLKIRDACMLHCLHFPLNSFFFKQWHER
jgi:hypothetical protein